MLSQEAAEREFELWGFSPPFWGWAIPGDERILRSPAHFLRMFLVLE